MGMYKLVLFMSSFDDLWSGWTFNNSQFDCMIILFLVLCVAGNVHYNYKLFVIGTTIIVSS